MQHKRDFYVAFFAKTNPGVLVMANRIARRTSLFSRVIFLHVIDVIATGYGFILAHVIYGDTFSALHGYAAVLAGCFFLLMATAFDLYGIRSQHLHLRHAQLSKILSVWIATLSLLLLLAYATKTSSVFSRIAVASWMILAPIFMYFIHFLLDVFYSEFILRSNMLSVAIAGCGKSAQNFIEKMQEASKSGMQITGVYKSNMEDAGRSVSIDGSLIKGDFQQLVVDAKNGAYDEIYIAVPMQAEPDIAFLVTQLSDCSAPVFFVPDIFTLNIMTSRVHSLHGVPIVSVYDIPMSSLDTVVKRLEDILIGLLIMAVIVLPMILIAIAIKLTSPGPVIFKQKRYGLGGEQIEVWKFRSMMVCDDGNVIVQARKNDIRVTRLGAFLRRTSLDELPQFLNVLGGSMSIVGPRPHAVAHNELYRKDIQGYMLRHLVKPGITGWAQINGWRGETDTIEKMEMRIKYDLEYIKNWSLWFDLKIIALTIIKGFVGKNVY